MTRTNKVPTTTDPKHSPTPWKVELLDAHRRNPVRVVNAHDGDVAVVALGDGVTREEAEANARLLAAAPDLLAACRDALEALADDDMHTDPPAVVALLAAIAKATGSHGSPGQESGALRRGPYTGDM
jgi:hypothetical protein